MVILSAVTYDEMEIDPAAVQTDESPDYMQTDESPDCAVGPWQNVCGLKARPIKILLTKDVSEVTKIESHQDGANVDAWLDEDGTVFVLIEDGKDICSLEAEEFQSLEDAAPSDDDEDVVAVEVEKSPTAVTREASSWEAEALSQIKRARARVASMEGRYLEAKERAKDAKTSWDASVEELTQVIDDATKPMPLFDQKPTTTESTSGQASESNATDDAWRNAPIDDVFGGLTGFGPKKQDALRDLTPTLGAFEDLRKKASLEGNPLKDYMPKGIGQDACDQLEEAALNWLSRLSKNAANGGDGGDAGEG